MTPLCFNKEMIIQFVKQARATKEIELLILNEEVGELIQAYLEETEKEELEELADVLIVIFNYAECAGFLDTLEEAVYQKMNKNLDKKRFTAQGKIKA